MICLHVWFECRVFLDFLEYLLVYMLKYLEGMEVTSLGKSCKIYHQNDPKLVKLLSRKLSTLHKTLWP